MLEHYFATAVEASDEHPVLIDKFLEDTAEVDVDAVCDGETVTIGGILEHIEEAGIHSGDSACVIPTKAISDEELKTIRKYTHTLAKELKVVGLMNVQYAVKDGVVYVLEVNPRASRTVPFVSKAIGRPLAKIAARVMVGQKLSEIGFTEEIVPEHISVKEAVLPFIKLPGVDTVLGPEMKSTGEVMGIADNFGEAFAKSQIAASHFLPTEGTAFISLNEGDKAKGPEIAEKFVNLGFKLMATEGTARYLREKGFEVIRAYKVNEGRPNVVDFMKNNKVDIVVNTPLGRESRYDEQSIRTNALQLGIPCITTTPAAHAALDGIAALKKGPLSVKAIQDYHNAMVKK
jgi:carbamoyl-phosphate synthase large subunit